MTRGVVPPNEIFRNAFCKVRLRNHPPARSRLLSRSCCPPDSGGHSANFGISGRSLSIDFESDSANLAGSISICPCHHDLFAAQGHLRNTCKLHLAVGGRDDRITQSSARSNLTDANLSALCSLLHPADQRIT